ncbi:MAG: amidohydrolase family protein [Proteobacteria bacterium]|nr:amidohydrolase family protein [Pseudomonadota bacterium]
MGLWIRAARRLAGAGLLCAAPVLVAAADAPKPVVADLVLTDARIYSAARPALADALAVRRGRLIYVGDGHTAQRFVGPKTIVRSVGGRLVVPGLVDSHIHPIDIVDLDVCDLASALRTLREIEAIVRGCVAKYHPRPGQWLRVHQWNPYGNLPDADRPSLRAALDRAAPDNPVELMGNDGHKGAYNSAALALARNAGGRQVGLSASTLSGEFSMYRKLVGVDARGEPNGEVNEDARTTMLGEMHYYDLEKTLAVAERITQRLNAAGITGVLDAAVSLDGLKVYDRLQSTGHLTVRVALAQYYDPGHVRKPNGEVDYDALVDRAVAVRARYADNPLVRADFVKLFADGVVEGNPFSVPPTLGNAALIEPYLQPIFAHDADGHATVVGYVDTGSEACTAARADPARYARPDEVAAFTRANGFHPGQCEVSNGRLQNDREVELEYVRRMHLAGFNVHIHAIGDRAVRTAIDAIEAARAADGVTTTRDGLAHVQLTRPEDVARMGRDHLFLAYTYSWATNRIDYDMTVIPFIQHVTGNSNASRHVPGSFYEEGSYPFRSSKDAGAVLVAGSDAPVDTRDPQPFVNMAVAVARRLPGDREAFNPRQAITIREVLDAYTINGARMLGRDEECGSLEAGKSADFVVLDRDILALADAGRVDEIAGTKVLETWFRGRAVYRAQHP